MAIYEPAIIISEYNKNGNPFDTIDAVKRAGFKNIFLEWYNKIGRYHKKKG